MAEGRQLRHLRADDRLGGPLRLTSDPAPDSAPEFSPGGRHIAFVRALPEAKCGIFLVPPLGGPERRVAEIALCQYPQTISVSWSPDGRWLAVPDSDAPGKAAALFLVSMESGEKRRLTAPRVLTDFGDLSAAFSPDGRTLAFTRYTVAIVTSICWPSTRSWLHKGNPHASPPRTRRPRDLPGPGRARNRF